MSVTTFQGVLEKGQIRLADDVDLPEEAIVYVVVPDLKGSRPIRIGSPRLVHREQAADFEMKVVVEAKDAGV